MNRHLFILILGLLSGTLLKGQRLKRGNTFTEQNNFLHDNGIEKNAYMSIGDTTFIMRGNCKNYWAAFFAKSISSPVMAQPFHKQPFLVIHGNVLYNFSYRSYIDTPFSQQDLQQHLVQTNIGFLLADRYPVQMTISSRSSNSPYFADRLDANVNFSRSNLMDVIKNRLRTKADSLVNRQPLYQAEELYAARQQKITSLQAWINHPQRQQELAREREKLRTKARGRSGETYKRPNLSQAEIAQLIWPENNNEKFRYKRPGIAVKSPGINADSIVDKPSINTDSIKNKIASVKDGLQVDSSVIRNYEEKKEELKKLVKELKDSEKEISNIKRSIQDSVNMLKRSVSAIQSNNELKDFIQTNNIPREELTKTQRALLAVNNIGLGRNWIDYSELTVKNITLTGINIELNPSKFYFAFAAGRVNYRFRDFIIKNDKNDLPHQSLYIVRAGAGKKEGNNIIFSFYNGKKASFDNSGTAGPSPLQRVLGVSAEARLKIDQNNYLIAEVAKSSFGNNIPGRPASTDDLIGKAFNMKVRSNEAYSIKLFSELPQTNTKITGYYRSMGEDFQSYNLFPSNINQDAWMLKVNQSFWKKIVTLEAAIRKNDFASPIAAPSFSSKTVFKSLQATFRKAKYPFVSVGYFPSSQLTLSNNNTLLENQYNTLNGVMSYSYQLRNTRMNSNAVYTKFYNSSNDAAFLYYNASSFSFNQNIFWGKLTSQSGASFTDQQDLQLFTVEQSLSYQLKFITVGGGVKWNKIKNSQSLFGALGQLGIQFRKLGTLQFNYEKTYLPAYNSRLMPVDIGRMSFYRQF